MVCGKHFVNRRRWCNTELLQEIVSSEKQPTIQEIDSGKHEDNSRTENSEKHKFITQPMGGFRAAGSSPILAARKWPIHEAHRSERSGKEGDFSSFVFVSSTDGKRQHEGQNFLTHKTAHTALVDHLKAFFVFTGEI